MRQPAGGGAGRGCKEGWAPLNRQCMRNERYHHRSGPPHSGRAERRQGAAQDMAEHRHGMQARGHHQQQAGCLLAGGQATGSCCQGAGREAGTAAPHKQSICAEYSGEPPISRRYGRCSRQLRPRWHTCGAQGCRRCAARRQTRPQTACLQAQKSAPRGALRWVRAQPAGVRVLLA